MAILLMKCISIVSAIWALCTCLGILAQTLSESFLPVPLIFSRLLGTLLATSQLVCSILVYFKLKQRSKLWGIPFYMFTTTAFCTTVNYITYTSLRRKYSAQDNQPYLDLSIIDTCMAFDFAIFIIFHLVIIFDCDDDDDKNDTDSNNRNERSTIPYQIFTIEAQAGKS